MNEHTQPRRKTLYTFEEYQALRAEIQDLIRKFRYSHLQSRTDATKGAHDVYVFAVLFAQQAFQNAGRLVDDGAYVAEDYGDYISAMNTLLSFADLPRP